jgi:hypothetical protein
MPPLDLQLSILDKFRERKKKYEKKMFQYSGDTNIHSKDRKNIVSAQGMSLEIPVRSLVVTHDISTAFVARFALYFPKDAVPLPQSRK